MLTYANKKAPLMPVMLQLRVICDTYETARYLVGHVASNGIQTNLGEIPLVDGSIEVNAFAIDPLAENEGFPNSFPD